MAPGARLVSLKVLGADGSGRTSDVISAIDYAIAHKERLGLGVLNLSLGRPVFESYVDDPLCQAVERAFRAGLVVVVSAGNYGKTEDGRKVLRRDWLAGQLALRADGGGGGRAGDGGAERRHGGGLQLVGADALRPAAEAGRGGARAAGGSRCMRRGARWRSGSRSGW